MPATKFRVVPSRPALGNLISTVGLCVGILIANPEISIWRLLGVVALVMTTDYIGFLVAKQ